MFWCYHLLSLLIFRSKLFFLGNLLLVNHNDRFALQLSTKDHVEQVLDLVQAVEDIGFDLDAAICDEANLRFVRKTLTLQLFGREKQLSF